MNISRTFFLYFRLMKVVFITYKSLITSPGSVLDTSVSSVRRLDGFVLSFGVKRMWNPTPLEGNKGRMRCEGEDVRTPGAELSDIWSFRFEVSDKEVSDPYFEIHMYRSGIYSDTWSRTVRCFHWLASAPQHWNSITTGESQRTWAAAVTNSLSLTGSQSGRQRLRLTGVCGCQWPVTTLGVNNDGGQLRRCCKKRQDPPGSSCYCCSTKGASVRAMVEQVGGGVTEEGSRDDGGRCVVTTADGCCSQHHGWKRCTV